MFAFGFFVWNLDNIFCTTLTSWKQAIGWPVAFLLEGASQGSRVPVLLTQFLRSLLVACSDGMAATLFMLCDRRSYDDWQGHWHILHVDWVKLYVFLNRLYCFTLTFIQICKFQI